MSDFTLHRAVLQSVVGASLAALAGFGCKSTLEEFQCTQAADCGDRLTRVARCEPSGHCSFLDASCIESGFRFGESSGPSSGECVAGGDEEPDAGTTTGPKPIARIVPSAPGTCGVSLIADGSTSEAFGSAELAMFSWTLLDANDQEIDSFVAPGEVPLTRGIHRLGGSHQAPNINLPNYHGLYALRANIDLPDRATVFQTDLNFFGLDLGTLGGEYQLFFAMGSEQTAGGANAAVVASLQNQSGDILFSQRFDSMDAFGAYQVDFLLEPSINGDFEGAILRFDFEEDGQHWLDNVGLVHVESGSLITANESAETGEEAPWKVGDGVNSFPGLVAREIPSEFRESEVYTVRLQVTDTNGLRSDLAELEINGNFCEGPF